MSDQALQTADPETFIGEFNTLDLNPLKDLMFMVAVSTGHRKEGGFLCKTVHGPYAFFEMLEEVGTMWKEHQHHAKVIVLDADRKKRVKWLDEPTIDYIEARYMDLIADGLLDGSFDEEKPDFVAGFNEAEETADPRHLKKDEVEEEDACEIVYIAMALVLATWLSSTAHKDSKEEHLKCECKQSDND